MSPLQIIKVADEKRLEGNELLDDLFTRLGKSVITAVHDKRMVFTRVRTYLEKLFGSFYTTEKNEPLVLIKQSLSSLRQNPHLKGRNEKIQAISNLLDTLTENKLMGFKDGISAERDYTLVNMKLLVAMDDGQEKQYEIQRKIPSAAKALEEEQKRANQFKNELEFLEQARATCEQIAGMIVPELEEEDKVDAATRVQKYFRDLENKLLLGQHLLTGQQNLPSQVIVELKLDCLGLVEELKDLSLIEKVLFLESLNWYRHKWAQNSFSKAEVIVYYLFASTINRHAPWNPKGDPGVRKALDDIGISCKKLEMVFSSQSSAGGEQEEAAGPSKINMKQSKIADLVVQLVNLDRFFAARKSVQQGNNLLLKFLRPGIHTERSRQSIKMISTEIQSHVKIDYLSRYMLQVVEDKKIRQLVGRLRLTLTDGHMDLFQQLQTLRVAHGLSNLLENRERERLSAFIAPVDVVQFLTSLAEGQMTVLSADQEKISFTVSGKAGEKFDPATRQLSRKGISYKEASGYINSEFENLLLSYEQDDFEARCIDCNPDFERENDPYVKIIKYAWIVRKYPFLKILLGGGLLLVSPIMYNLLEGEKKKKNKTISDSTAEFMGNVVALVNHLVGLLDKGCKDFDVGPLDQKRVKAQEEVAAGEEDAGDADSLEETGDDSYCLLLEEGVRELFPKVGFELQVLLEQLGEGFEGSEDVFVDDERALTDEERAFEEKYSHLLIEAEDDHAAVEATERKVSLRSVTMLSNSLENISVFYERLKSEGYVKRIPVMRRDQIASNIRDGCFSIEDILKNLDPEDQSVPDLLRKTDKLLKSTRKAIQRTGVFEEQVNIEQENVEVPLYEVHSILVTLNSSYMVTLQSLLDVIYHKHLTSSSGLVKTDQINATKKVFKSIDAALNTLIRNSHGIKLDSPKIVVGLRDAMIMNINACIGEINRLKRSQLIIQNCQHPNDLHIYLNVIARQIIDRKLVVPLTNIQGTLKKTPTSADTGEKYAVWKPGGEEQISSSAFGKMRLPVIDINDAPKVLRSVIQVSDSLADHFKARSELFREQLVKHKQTVPRKTNFDYFSERISKNVSGILGQLQAFFIPDKDGNISFEPGKLDDIMRNIGIGVGELLSMNRDFSRNKAMFATEIEAFGKIAPVLEGLRNCVDEYNPEHLMQKKSADLARSKTNCDKTLIGFCQQLGKYSDPTTREYKLLVIRGRVYLALENMVQEILGAIQVDYNAERKKKLQQLVNELFYMMSHVNVEDRDLPLFKKFLAGALKAARDCGNPALGASVTKLIKFGEEVRDWLKVAASAFSNEVINDIYKPGLSLDRLKKLGDSM